MREAVPGQWHVNDKIPAEIAAQTISASVHNIINNTKSVIRQGQGPLLDRAAGAGMIKPAS